MGLLVTVVLLAIGTLVGYLALRKAGNDHATPDLEATLAAELAAPDYAASLESAPPAADYRQHPGPAL